MEKIYFESINRLHLSLLIFCATTLLLLLSIESVGWHIYFISFILAGLIGYFSPFVFSNYVRHNRTHVHLKLGSKKGYNVTIKDIEKVHFLKSILIIQLYSGDSFVFNTKNICKKSIATLEDLLNQIISKEVNDFYMISSR